MYSVVKSYEGVVELGGHDVYVYYDDADCGWVLVREYEGDTMNVVAEWEFPECNVGITFKKMEEYGFPFEIVNEVVCWFENE